VKQSQDLTLRRASRLSQLREYAIQGALIACSLVAIFTTIGIVASLAFEAIRFFGKIPIQSFLFGLEWSPQTAIRDDQVGASGAFGVLPLLAGTLLISCIAMTVATPLGLLSAVPDCCLWFFCCFGRRAAHSGERGRAWASNFFGKRFGCRVSHGHHARALYFLAL